MTNLFRQAPITISLQPNMNHQVAVLLFTSLKISLEILVIFHYIFIGARRIQAKRSTLEGLPQGIEELLFRIETTGCQYYLSEIPQI